MSFSELVNKVDVVKVSNDRNSITCRIIRHSNDVNLDKVDNSILESLVIESLGEYIFSSYCLSRKSDEIILVGYIN